MSLDMSKYCEACGENVRGYGHAPTCELRSHEVETVPPKWSREMAEKRIALIRGEQIALLRNVIAQSGLSNRQYAERVLMRDERTLRRWLSGTQHIPLVVLRMLATT